MNCPRCKTAIPPLADPDSIVTCPGCGSRLMTRSAAMRSQAGKPAPTSPPSSPTTPPPVAPPPARAAAPDAAALPPSATLPPTPASQLGVRRGDEPPPLPASRAESGSKRKAAAAAVAEPSSVSPAANAFLTETLELLVREVRALRAMQEQVLALLDRGAGYGSPASPELDLDDVESALSPIRARRRKTVLLVDDDPATRAAAVAELQQADVPVRAFDDGSAALSGIAEEKPDVIVLELALGGEMAGKDLINVIKATMEWVDLPIVLWTRVPISNQKEARQVHGADEIVPKSAGVGALLARVITVFRRI